MGARLCRAGSSGMTPGTGLGMAIVKEMLALHGGQVEAAPEPGAGTTVTHWWPARPRRREPRARLEHQADDPGVVRR
jgi:signal transduction histidine kinase